MPLSKVRVLCPNGRRQVVQVDANTSILLIRETVCQKQSFDVQSHELKFHKRSLDDSSNLRFENIPNNAELELVKSTRQLSSGAQSKIVILLQSEDGKRSSKEFLQTATLWDVVTEFEHKNCKEGMQHACRYLMKTVIGKEDLQKTTLRSLGIIDGRVCLRYMEVPLLRKEGQAHVVSLDLSRVNGNIQQEKQLLGSSLKDDVMYSITEWDNANGVKPDEKKEELAVADGSDVDVAQEMQESSADEVRMAGGTFGSSTDGFEEKVKKNEDLGRTASCASKEGQMQSQHMALENQETATKEERDQSQQLSFEKHETATKEVRKQSQQLPLETHETATEELGMKSQLISFENQETASKEIRRESPQFSIENQETGEDVEMKDASSEHCSSSVSPAKEMSEDLKVVNVDGENSIADINIEYLDDNGSVLLDPSLSTQPHLKWDPPDDFFEFTLADAYLLQKRLREQAVSESTLMLRGTNKRTQSKTYDLCIVRIHLPPPEELLLQSTFRPSDSIADILSFVKGYLKSSNLGYYLFTTPPKQVLDPSSTLSSNDLVPSCLVHLGIHSSDGDSSESLVKDDIRSKAVSIDAYNKKMGRKELKRETCQSGSWPKQLSEEEMDSSGAASTARYRANVNRTPQKNPGGVPKWFKLGKK